jgi:hypothetical protein
MPKSLEQCKATHGEDVGQVTIAGVLYVFGNPTRDAWRKWRAAGTALGASESADPSTFAGRAEHVLEVLEELARTACLSHNPMELESAADVCYDTLAELGQAVAARFEAKQAALGKG